MDQEGEISGSTFKVGAEPRSAATIVILRARIL
jgi:hypothetical protein